MWFTIHNDLTTGRSVTPTSLVIGVTSEQVLDSVLRCEANYFRHKTDVSTTKTVSSRQLLPFCEVSIVEYETAYSPGDVW